MSKTHAFIFNLKITIRKVMYILKQMSKPPGENYKEPVRRISNGKVYI